MSNLLPSRDVDAARRRAERIRIKARTITEQYESLRELLDEAERYEDHLALGYASWTAYLADLFGDEPLRLPRDERIPMSVMLTDAGVSTRAAGQILGVDQKTIVNDVRSGEENSSPAAGTARTGSTIATAEGVVIAQAEHIDPATGEVVLGSVAALAEVVANSHPISRDAVDNLGENLNTGPQSIELGTHGEPNEGVAVVEVLEDRVVGLEAGLDVREDVLNTHAPTVAKITGLDGKTYTRPERTATRRRPLPDVALDAAHALTAAVARMERVFTDDRYPQNKEQVARYTRHHLPQAVETLQRLADEITQ